MNQGLHRVAGQSPIYGSFNRKPNGLRVFHHSFVESRSHSVGVAVKRLALKDNPELAL